MASLSANPSSRTGLASRPAGDGIPEDDEADMLMPEIESLIEHCGPAAAEEDFPRYKQRSCNSSPCSVQFCFHQSAMMLPTAGLTR